MKYDTKISKDVDHFPTGAKRGSNVGKGFPSNLSPLMLQRVSELLERGAAHYGELNYAKGMPMMRTMDSLLRHAFSFLEGKRDEDHLAAVVFNAMVLIHTQEMIQRGRLPKELDDMPDYTTNPECPKDPRKRECS